MTMDKGLKRELRELGLHPGEKPFILDKDSARDLGLKCLDCSSPKTVYFISKPLGKLFEPGAYCYKCLLKRCRAAKMIPIPIETWLQDKLQADMGIKPGTPYLKI